MKPSAVANSVSARLPLERWGLPALLLIALAYRLASLALLPVVHDEIIVIARGMSQMFLSGDPVDLLFRVPATNSNGITPLWWWIQVPPLYLLGETSRLGLRLVPLLLGLAGTFLAHRAGGLLGGARAAWFAGLLWAAGDLILYTNSKGDFVASFTGVAGLALLLDLLPRPGSPSEPRLRAALWPALILLTYLGHGLILWASYSIYLAARHVATCGRDEALRPRRLGRVAAMALLPLAPSLVWMLGAQAFLFGGGTPLVTDIGPVSSVWDHLWRLTWGYGTVTKTYMVGAWSDALYVYRDFAVWPTLALIAVPGMVSLMSQGARLITSRSNEPEARAAALLPLCFVVPTLGVLVAKGAVAGRFHLLYLPIVLPFVAVVVERWTRLLERGEWRRFAAAGIAQCAFVAWAASWSLERRGPRSFDALALSFLVGAGALAALVLVGRLAPLRRHAGGAATLGVTLLVLASSAFRGPLVWARRLAWEPEPNNRTPMAVAKFPNVDLQLARTFVERELDRERIRQSGVEDLQEARRRAVVRARPLLLRAMERHPDDRATLVEAGVALLTFSAEDRPIVEALLANYSRRHPRDPSIEAVRARLGAARDAAPAAPRP